MQLLLIFAQILTLLVVVSLSLATYLRLAVESLNALRGLRIARSFAGIGFSLTVIFWLAGAANFYAGPYAFGVPLVMFMLFAPPVRLLTLFKNHKHEKGFICCYGIMLVLLTLAALVVLWGNIFWFLNPL